jgi:hypothetical protein
MSEKLLGEDYPYYKYIKSPGELGMSSKGTMDTLAKDVSGLIDYVQLLVAGNSKASATGKAMGNKYFLDTRSTCVDEVSGESKPRYIYIDNVPEGNIPLLSSGTGVNFSEFRGLMPGVMSNLNVLSPTGLMNAFTTGSNPKCKEITMQTIDTENNKSSGTYYVALADISIMDPCSFSDKKNPVTGAKCREGFQNSKVALRAAPYQQKEPPIVKFYYASVATLGVYILYRLMQKK